MNLKRLVCLAIFLLLALGYIFYIEKPRQKSISDSGKLFNAVPRQSINSIEISGGKGAYVLVNSKAEAAAEGDKPIDDSTIGDWGFSDLPNADLDLAALNSLLTSVVEFDCPDKLEAKDLDPDLSVYGLAKPETKLVLKSGDKTQTLEFGNRNEYVRRRYARLNGEQICLGGEGLFNILGKSRSDYRSRNPIKFQDSEVSEIDVVLKSGGSFSVKNGDPGKWKLAKPIEASCSNEVVSNLTRQLRGVAISDFMDSANPSESSFNLAAPEALFTVSFKDSKREPLKIRASSVAGGKDGSKNASEVGAYFTLSGRAGILKTSQDLVSFGRIKIDKLREKKLFNFALDDAVGVRSESARGGSQALALESGAWKVNGKEADLIFVREYLRTLADTTAVGFPTKSADFGFNNPSARISVLQTRAGSASSRELVVGSKTDYEGKPGYFAAVDGQSEPFIISEQSFKKLVPKEEVLLKTAEPTPQPSKSQ